MKNSEDTSKKEELKKYSNFNQVKQKVKKLLGKDKEVLISSRRDKKYMIKAPNDKMVHFGQMGYEDFTKHKDEERRENFLKRNAKWKDSPIYSPAWLSYYILW